MKSLIFIAFSLCLDHTYAYNLEQVIVNSLEKSEVEKINNSKLKALEADKVSAKSGLHPKIYFKSQITKNENIAKSETHSIYLTQNIYKGGKDLASINLANNSIEAISFSDKSEILNVKINAITYFFQAFSNKLEFQNLKLLEKQSLDRVQEIASRTKIGRSRSQELLSAKAQLASVKAQLLNAEGNYLESQKKLIDFAGVSESDFPEFDINQSLKVFDLKRLEEALLNRPELKNKKLKIEEQQINLDLNKRSHYPTVDLSSNYYLKERTGIYRNSSWDVAITLSMPIYEGYSTDAKIQNSMAKNLEAELNYNSTLLSLKLDLHSKYENFKRYQNQEEAFSEALELSKKNYEESLKDYRLGLISHLDVLTSLNQYLDLKRNTEKNKVLAFMSQKILETSYEIE